MHAERLNSIASETVDAYKNSGISQMLDGLIQDVSQRRANPADVSWDEKISSDVKAVLLALDALPVGRFPPTWLRIMTELHLTPLFPDVVRSAIDDAFRHRLVDSDLLDSLQKLSASLHEHLQSLEALEAGFEAVGIGTDELAADEVAFEIAMPRKSISDDLSGLHRQIGELSRQLKVLSEIATQPVPSFTVNSISTNDFSFSIHVNLDLGDILSVVLVYLAMARQGAKAKFDALSVDALHDLPESIRQQMKEWANTHIKQAIKGILERLPQEAPKAINRAKLDSQPEPVTKAIEYLAERMDSGCDMDVRVGVEAPANKAGEDSPEAEAIAQRRERMLAIAEKSSQLKMIERQDAPILGLTSPIDGSGTKSNTE